MKKKTKFITLFSQQIVFSVSFHSKKIKFEPLHDIMLQKKTFKKIQIEQEKSSQAPGVQYFRIILRQKYTRNLPKVHYFFHKSPAYHNIAPASYSGCNNMYYVRQQRKRAVGCCGVMVFFYKNSTHWMSKQLFFEVSIYLEVFNPQQSKMFVMFNDNFVRSLSKKSLLVKCLQHKFSESFYSELFFGEL